MEAFPNAENQPNLYFFIHWLNKDKLSAPRTRIACFYNTGFDRAWHSLMLVIFHLAVTIM